jgi:RimK family alpha-L-glutamate ligase
MNIAVITPNPNSAITNSIYEAILKQGVHARKIKISAMNVDLSKMDTTDYRVFNSVFKGMNPDGAINRGIGINKTKKIFYRVDLYRALEILEIPLINSRECLELATNKVLTSLLLRKKGINTPETIACETYESAVKAFHTLGGDIVIKPMYGARGKGIIRVNEEGLAENILNNLSQLDEPFYLQKYYDHDNRDIRAFILGDKVIAAMERISDNWKTNIAKGAIAKSIEIDKEAQEIAIKSAQLVKGEIIGVDIMKTKNGYVVIEVNSVPGFAGLQSTTKLDIAAEIAKYCIGRFKK